MKKTNNKGITLVALIVTIIVLLILAGVSLNAVFNKNGIFSKAEQATKLYGKEKSRDELTIALADAEMKKYTSGLTKDELNEILNQVGQVDDNDNTRVTVDGHIWQIDRDKLEIVDYLGEDDGIEIRYTIEGYDNWISGTPNIKVKVTVRNNKGTLDINSIQITKNGAPLTGIAISNNGEFELSVTEVEGATFTVSAKNSKGEQSTPRTIKVTPKDTIAPTIGTPSVVAGTSKITISVSAADNETGIKEIRYNISPTTVEPEIVAIGTLKSGETKEIKVTALGEYTVTFVAEDNAGNISETVTGKATVDTISIADLKAKITASNYPEYLGAKVSDYNSGDTKAWRVFYYDATGEYGDTTDNLADAGTIYLKRDYDENTRRILSSYAEKTSATAKGLKMMKLLNKDWASKDGNADNPNEKAAAGLCDTDNWTSYKTTEARYAIGAAPVEMWTKVYNAYLGKYEPSKVATKTLSCSRYNDNGYGWRLGMTGEYSYSKQISIDTRIPQSEVVVAPDQKRIWLASPSGMISSSGDKPCVCFLWWGGIAGQTYSFMDRPAVCPVVALNP